MEKWHTPEMQFAWVWLFSKSSLDQLPFLANNFLQLLKVLVLQMVCYKILEIIRQFQMNLTTFGY